MVAKRIEAIETNPGNPAASMARFSDGSSFYGPTEHIQSAYEQQKANERASMLAMNNTSSGGGAPSYVVANTSGGASSAAPVAPQPVLDVGPNMSAAPEESPVKPWEQRVVGSDPGQLRGLASAGVTDRDLQVARGLQQLDPRISPLDVLAARKTVSVPGTPEISQRTAGQMIAMPSARSTTVEGARPVDEARWKDVQDKTRLAVDAQANAQIAEGQAAFDTAQAQSLAAQQLHDQMAQQQARDEAEFRARHDYLTQEVDRASRGEVDPSRWFKQHGAIGSMLMILGSALTEAAKGKVGQAGGPTALERFISMDIASQENELARRGANANNKLADLSRQWGSIEAGKAALRSQQLRVADSRLAEIQANGRNAMLKQQAAALRAQTEKQIAQADYDLYAAAQGTKRETENAVMMMPRKATSGGTRTTYDFGKLASNMREGQELDIKGVNAAKAGNEQVEGRTERLGERLAQYESSLDAANKYFESVGMQRDESGKWVQKGDHPLYGAADTARNALPAALMSNEANRADANLAIAAESYGRAQSGAAISDEERKAFRRQLAGTGQADAADAANAFESLVKSRMASLKAGAGSEASGRYERGKVLETAVDRAKAKSQGADQRALSAGKTGLRTR